MSNPGKHRRIRPPKHFEKQVNLGPAPTLARIRAWHSSASTLIWDLICNQLYFDFPKDDCCHRLKICVGIAPIDPRTSCANIWDGQCVRIHLSIPIKGEMMAGKFELYKDTSGKFRFRLKAGNGEIIASSEAYNTKVGAQDGIQSVKTNAPGAVVVDLNL